MDEFMVTCPYCGEDVTIVLEDDVRGALVQDCEICCRPWLLRVTRGRDGAGLEVRRADGSE